MEFFLPSNYQSLGNRYCSARNTFASFFTKIYSLVYVHSFLLRKYKLFLSFSRNITNPFPPIFQNRLSKWNHRSNIFFFLFFRFLKRFFRRHRSIDRSNSSTTVDQHSPLFYRVHEQFLHLKQTHSLGSPVPQHFPPSTSIDHNAETVTSDIIPNPSFRLDHFVEARVSSNSRETTLSNFVIRGGIKVSKIVATPRDKSTRKAEGAIHQNPTALFCYLCFPVRMIIPRGKKFQREREREILSRDPKILTHTFFTSLFLRAIEQKKTTQKLFKLPRFPFSLLPTREKSLNVNTGRRDKKGCKLNRVEGKKKKEIFSNELN